jgi:hypothetical protein
MFKNKIRAAAAGMAGAAVAIGGLSLADVASAQNGLSSPFGGDLSVREGDVDAGAAEVDHRDQRVG